MVIHVLLLSALLFARVYPAPQVFWSGSFGPFRPARQVTEQCQTPAGIQGRCVLLTECQPILQIVGGSNWSPELVDFLRKSSCGFVGIDPKVCCPSAIEALRPTTKPSTVPKQATTIRATTQQPARKNILPESCGFSKYTDLRIVGGSEARPGAWPWMAVLLYRNETSKKVSHQCDGILITDRHVLTAAHCLDGRNKLYRVRLGDHQTNSANDSTTQDARIDGIFSHENYTRTVITNDIALIKLKDKVNFTDNVRPICLPRDKFFGNSSNLVSETAVVAGWGRTSEGGNGSKILREVRTEVVSPTSCQDSYSGVTNVRINGNVLCAGTVTGGRGFCQGDSGGPLMLPFGTDGKYYLVGVVSHAVGCARANFPGIYVNVPKYMDWILNKMSL